MLPVKRKALKKANRESSNNNNENDLNQFDDSKNDGNRMSLKSETLAKAVLEKKSKHSDELKNDVLEKKSKSSDELKKDEKPESNEETDAENMTIWQLLIQITLSLLTLTKNFYDKIKSCIFTKEDKSNQTDVKKVEIPEPESDLEKQKKLKKRYLVLWILIAVCCLGFVLDVVRQHMHPEKYGTFLEL